MAVITFMSWNIQNYGRSKYYLDITIKKGKKKVKIEKPHPNRYPLMSLIAKTAERNNAGILSILELSKSTADIIAKDIKTQLNLTYIVAGKGTGDWTYSLIKWNISRYSGEVYALFWRTGLGFTKVDDPADTTNILRGLTNTNTGGTVLKFQRGKNNTGSNGRPPGYFAFKTTGTGAKYFTILCYHAMFNQSARDYWGVESYAGVAPVTRIVDGGSAKTVGASLLSGDLNVDYINDSSEYSNLESLGTMAIDKSWGNRAKTSLVNTTPPGGYPNSTDYRVNAYDNIACKGTTGMTNNKVIDMIADLKTGSSNPYDTYTASFDKNAIVSINPAGLTLPPAEYDDSWELYKYAVSDHLPVVATVTI